MKKIFASLIASLILLWLLSACSQTTCPTYAKYDGMEVEAKSAGSLVKP
jgi:outer membrane protein assembly factor BamE (lipoprotein component of BamABCDE complex)